MNSKNMKEKKNPNRFQIILSDRHLELLQQSMDLLQISKSEAVNRAIEGLSKVAKMQRKVETEKPSG
jgi:hypothetical protein